MSIISGGSSGASGTAGTEIGYDQITAAVTVTSATEATGTLVVQATAYTFDGLPVIAEFYSPGIIPASGVADHISISLFESTTELILWGKISTPAANILTTPVCLRYRFTPTAGSHTYKVTAYRGSVNGTVQAGLGGTATYSPAFLRFVKV